MRKRRVLDVLLPRTRQEILAAVLLQPAKEWYSSELAHRMGVRPSSLQRELTDLARAGILKTQRKGRMTYYQANVDTPIFPDLRGLLLKTAGLVDVLAEALKPLARKISVAFVFGSMANASERSESDVDLLVVGTVSPAELALPLRRARDVIGREINPSVYSVAEFTRKRAENDHFLTRVLDAPRLQVLGTSDELEKTSR